MEITITMNNDIDTYNQAATDKINVLIVEDDTRLAELIQDFMEEHDISVSIENRGDQAAMRILNEKPDLVILDIMLPGADGYEVCRKIRSKYSGPIMMLTAKNEDIDQVIGLELGADDYVTKPVQPRVLLARIRALLRRPTVEEGSASGSNTKSDELVFGRLKIDWSSQEVKLDDKTIDLTTYEFKLLWFLATHAGCVLSRDELFSSLRGIGYDGMDRSIDVRISKIRKKLGDSSTNPTKIKTIWGRGYLFVRDAWS